MHDPMTVAFTIPRPWPQRSSMSATGSRGDAVRWRLRLHHDHGSWCADAPPGHGAFPWWRPGSYSRFWRLAGRDIYWPPLITIWHVEPHGRDGLTVCGGWRTTRNGDRRRASWKWHVVHAEWHETLVTVTDPGGTVPHRIRYPVIMPGWKIQVHPAQHLRRALLTRCAWCGGRSRDGDPVNVSHSWDGPAGHWWQGEPGLYHTDCSSVEHAHRMCFCANPLLPGRHGYGTCAMCGKFRAWNSEPDDADRLLRGIPAGGRIPPGLRPQIEAAWAARHARNEADA
jgi:hypothetical protein